MNLPAFKIGPIDQTAVYGFVAGFILAWLIFGLKIIILKIRSKKEIKKLKTNLESRINIETASIKRLTKEKEELEKKNSNMQTSLKNLAGKTGKKEKLQLQVYQSAIEKMSIRAPGFASAWHIVLKECEEETSRSLIGKIPFIGKASHCVGTGWPAIDLTQQPAQPFQKEHKEKIQRKKRRLFFRTIN